MRKRLPSRIKSWADSFGIVPWRAMIDLKTIKRRIEGAAKTLPLDQLALGPQCGFASEDGQKA